MSASYSDAKNEAAWVEAMKVEITALERNHTWKITYLPIGKKPRGYKWVYKVKLKVDDMWINIKQGW